MVGLGVVWFCDWFCDWSVALWLCGLVAWMCGCLLLNDVVVVVVVVGRVCGWRAVLVVIWCL